MNKLIGNFINKILENKYFTINKFFWLTVSIHIVLYFSNDSEYILNLISSKITFNEKIYMFIFYILTLFTFFKFISFYKISISYLYHLDLKGRIENYERIEDHVSYLYKIYINKLKFISFFITFLHLFSLLKYYKYFYIYIIIYFVLNCTGPLKVKIVQRLHEHKGTI